MRRALALLALLAGGPASAVELPAVFHNSGSATVTLESPVDDAHLADPPGYFAPQPPVARVMRRIVIENTGTTPIKNPDLRLNGRPLLPVADPVEVLGFADTADLLALFAEWRDRVVHGTTDLDASREPLALLHVFGVAFCGDDARALAAITTAHGGAARFARLNGHSVTEHKLGDGDWMLLDGDQNLFYLGWDNVTPVSEDDILADPLLALRTQVFGRHSSWQLDAAWQNTSRFEFVDTARAQKEFHLKSPPAPHDWELRPHQQLTIDFAEIPERVYAANDGLARNATLRAAACVVRISDLNGQSEMVPLPYPTLQTSTPNPVYETTSGKILGTSCQAARSQFPTLRTGPNRVTFQGRGNLRVIFDVEATALPPVPAPVIRGVAPRCFVEVSGVDRIWWQLSADANFHLVAPNFDRVSEYAPKLPLTPIDETFLTAGVEYHLRAKVRSGGVWSDWSVPAKFLARKPTRPIFTGIEGADGDQNRIRWKPAPGEMLVFGSDRLDFLPDVYGGPEVTRMENGAIRESRPNKNLLATISAADGEAYVPVRACYRLIARESGALSVPSALVRPKNMPARVLQNRHEKTAGALTGQDVAVEMDTR